jgi:uncharacterized membrane protein
MIAAQAFGSGLGGFGLLFFALTYLAMSKQFGFSFSNWILLFLLIIDAFCIGFARSILEQASNHNDYIGLFSTLGLPLILSILVIYIAKPLGRAKTKRVDGGQKSE